MGALADWTPLVDGIQRLSLGVSPNLLNFTIAMQIDLTYTCEFSYCRMGALAGPLCGWDTEVELRCVSQLTQLHNCNANRPHLYM